MTLYSSVWKAEKVEAEDEDELAVLYPAGLCFFSSMLFGKADGTVGTRPSWKGIKDFCLSWGAARELNQPCDV